MRPEERDPAYLWDMRDAARAVLDFVGGRSREQFLAPGREADVVRLAVERKLEILGEAARRVSEGFRAAHPELPWREIVGLRNVISHQYDKVSYDEVYGIVREKVPDLIRQLEPLIPPIPDIED